jgi:PadR family transcriptional regulator PadR
MKTPGPNQDAADKWEVQLRKGCLELAILAALWEGKLYGLEILRRPAV